MISVSLVVVSVDVVERVAAVAVVVDVVELAVVVVTVVVVVAVVVGTVVVDAGFIGILATTQDDMTDPEEGDASIKSVARASLQEKLLRS